MQASGEVRAAADRSLAIWAGAGLATFLLSGALAFGLGTAIARPLIRMSRAFTAIGRGKSEVDKPQGGPRYVPSLAARLAEFRDTVSKRRRTRLEQEEI